MHAAPSQLSGTLFFCSLQLHSSSLIKWLPSSASPCAPQALRLELTAPGQGILRVRLTDPHSPRWEVPAWLFKSPLLSGKGANGTPLEAVSGTGTVVTGSGSSKQRVWQAGDVQVELKHDPFSLEVARAAPGELGGAAGRGVTLFNTTGTRLAHKVSRTGLPPARTEAERLFALPSSCMMSILSVWLWKLPGAPLQLLLAVVAGRTSIWSCPPGSAPRQVCMGRASGHPRRCTWSECSPWAGVQARAWCPIYGGLMLLRVLGSRTGLLVLVAELLLRRHTQGVTLPSMRFA